MGQAMSAAQNVVTIAHIDKVCLLTLNRPERRNALSDELMAVRGEAILDAFRTEEAKTSEYAKLTAALKEIYADRGIPYRAMCGRDIRVAVRIKRERMGEIHRRRLDAGEDRMRLANDQVVPAHVRHLERRAVGPQARGDLVIQGVFFRGEWNF